MAYVLHTTEDGDRYAAETDDGGKLLRAWGPLDDALAFIAESSPDDVQRWLDRFDEVWPDGRAEPVLDDDGAPVMVDQRPVLDAAGDPVMEGGAELMTGGVVQTEVTHPSTRERAAHLKGG